ncbi:hypothetical protein, partial [Segatella buccae]|uniref:hypothetical protein n=1 Tax=Segatella buccae TaxID=28126 RepID=UPI003FD82615
ERACKRNCFAGPFGRFCVLFRAQKGVNKIQLTDHQHFNGIAKIRLFTTNCTSIENIASTEAEKRHIV